MSGYGGHRPGVHEVVSQSSTGGIPFKMPAEGLTGQGANLKNRPTTSWMSFNKDSKNTRVQEEERSRAQTFKDAIGGVKLGYTGFVPGARSHFETSHLTRVS
jgi:hypothetical protein